MNVQWKCLGRVVYLSKTWMIFLATIVCVGMVAGGYFLLSGGTLSRAAVTYRTATASPEGIAVTPQLLPETTPENMVWEIYIVGAVRNPGIYTLEEGALVHDAVEAAGGLLQSVDPATVNMVQELEDHLMIRILPETERQSQERDSSLVLTKNGTELGDNQAGGGNNGGATEKININTATKEVLMTLPGIGEARAESIIAYREEQGPFQAIEDIMQVSGIKESAFAKIKDRITT